MKTRRFLQRKLWRDKAVALLEAHGSRMQWRRLDDAEFDQQLRRHLNEEAAEVAAARDQKELVAELADVLELVDALCALHNLDRNAIVAQQAKKRADRGGFEARMFVEVAEHVEGSFGANYCLADPEKYPEIK